MTIGTAATAALALARALPAYSFNGTARIVYRDGDVVYKVERSDEWGSNDAEWNKYNEIDPAILPPHIRIPNMARYVIDGAIVLAVEFISGREMGECWELIDNGECDCPPGICISEELIEDIRGLCDVTDLAIGNVILRDGVYYVVDLEV